MITNAYALLYVFIVVYNLTESIDIDETNTRVEEYKKLNADTIIAQQTKYQEEKQTQQSNIQNEKRQMELAQMNLQVCI